jgi:hypothetical protein
MAGFGEGRCQCSGNTDASTSPGGRETWRKRQYLRRCELCFGDAAEPGEGRGQNPVRATEPWVGFDRPPCRVHRFLVTILRKMSNCKPNVRGVDERVKWAQSDSAFTPFEGPLRLVRPTHRKAAKNEYNAAGWAQRQCCFEGLDRGTPICSTIAMTNPARPRAVASSRL